MTFCYFSCSLVVGVAELSIGYATAIETSSNSFTLREPKARDDVKELRDFSMQLRNLFETRDRMCLFE